MTRARATLLAVLAGSLALAGCDIDPRTAVLPGGTGNDGYQVTATFADVDNLVSNSAVQYHDVRIGTVDSINLDHRTWQARVRIALQKDQRLPRNVVAKVGQTSLLGAEYVELDDPARPSGQLAAGDAISEASTGTYPGTEEVLSAVSLLLNNGGLSQIRTITTQLNDALDGRTGVARSLLSRLTTFVGDIDAQKRKLIAATTSLNALSGKLADDRTTLATALQRITPAVGTLNTDEPDLATALTALGQLSTVASKVIERNRANVAGDLAKLDPTLTKLAQTGKALPDSLPLLGSFPFSINTLHNAIRGDYLNLFETLDLSVSSVQRDFLGSVPIIGGAPITDATDPVLGPLHAVGAPTTVPTTTPSTAPAASSPLSPSPTAPTSAPTASSSSAPSSSAPSCTSLGQLLGSC